MKSDNTVDRIKGCMLMEFSCSSICHLMALNFPAQNELWNELARSEERHAELIANALGLEIQEYPAFDFPLGFDRVKKTIDYAEEIKAKLIEKVSLKEALLMVKRLQELKSETYQLELIEREKVDKVRNVFKKLLDIDNRNMYIIQAVMDAYAIKPDGSS